MRITALLILSLVTITFAQKPATRPTTVASTMPDEIATGLNPAHKPIFSYAIHNSAFSPDGKRVVTGGGDGVRAGRRGAGRKSNPHQLRRGA